MRTKPKPSEEWSRDGASLHRADSQRSRNAGGLGAPLLPATRHQFNLEKNNFENCSEGLLNITRPPQCSPFPFHYCLLGKQAAVCTWASVWCKHSPTRLSSQLAAMVINNTFQAKVQEVQPQLLHCKQRPSVPSSTPLAASAGAHSGCGLLPPLCQGCPLRPLLFSPVWNKLLTLLHQYIPYNEPPKHLKSKPANKPCSPPTGCSTAEPRRMDGARAQGGGCAVFPRQIRAKFQGDVKKSLRYASSRWGGSNKMGNCLFLGSLI